MLAGLPIASSELTDSGGGPPLRACWAIFSGESPVRSRSRRFFSRRRSSQVAMTPGNCTLAASVSLDVSQDPPRRPFSSGLRWLRTPARVAGRDMRAAAGPGRAPAVRSLRAGPVPPGTGGARPTPPPAEPRSPVGRPFPSDAARTNPNRQSGPRDSSGNSAARSERTPQRPSPPKAGCCDPAAEPSYERVPAASAPTYEAGPLCAASFTSRSLALGAPIA